MVCYNLQHLMSWMVGINEFLIIEYLIKTGWSSERGRICKKYTGKHILLSGSSEVSEIYWFSFRSHCRKY